MAKNEFKTEAKLAGIDESLGIVLGIAIICEKDGEKYFDLQGDHIPEDVMLKAAVDFAQGSRVAAEMHKSVEQRGEIIFMFPLTSEVKKAYDIEADFTGLLIAMKPDEEMLTKFKTGELTGFSIGGSCVRD